MVPAQKLPHGSGLPSLNLVTDWSTEKSPKGRRFWPSGPDRANPPARARIRPPSRPSPTVPTISPVPNELCVPLLTSSACTWPRRMSTQRSSPRAASQTGPSASSHWAGNAMSASSVLVTMRRLHRGRRPPNGGEGDPAADTLGEEGVAVGRILPHHVVQLAEQLERDDAEQVRPHHQRALDQRGGDSGGQVGADRGERARHRLPPPPPRVSVSARRPRGA